MGLRETKAARARQRMMDAALDLFTQQGYDETTMEQVAEAAEVGTSTLYRYFPTKDQLLLDRLADSVDFAAALRARPAGEPLGEALGAALLDVAALLDDPRSRTADVRRLVDAAPVARARLWDRFQSTREDLEAAIAERTDQDRTSLAVRLAAGLLLELSTAADEVRKHDGDGRTGTEVVAGLLTELPGVELVLPQPPRTLGAR